MTPHKDETVVAVNPYESTGDGGWNREAGFQIQTTAQIITLAIDDQPSCCESWGYFLTEDNTEKFIGARLLGVRITDTNRSGRRFTADWSVNDGDDVEHLDAGDVMFVDIETDRGVLQFVAYNAHNGYYGHEARVSSMQLRHRKVL